MRYRRVPKLGEDYAQTMQRLSYLERIVQTIGFTPDYPYTLNVNDGTRNRVEIGKIGSDYGIRIVNNAGVEIVFADGHISATGITTGTLDASQVTVSNLNAGSITTGTLSASKISGGTLNCSLMTVSNLSASSITTGDLSANRISGGTLNFNNISVSNLSASSITTGTLSVDRLSANSITAVKLSVSNLSDIAAALGTVTSGTVSGALIRTSSSGQRIELTSANLLKFYDSGGTSRAQFYESSGDLYITCQYDLVVNCDKLHLDTGYLQVDGYMTVGSFIGFGTRSSAPSVDWALYMYSSGGYGLKTRMSGGNWSVDQTSGL